MFLPTFLTDPQRKALENMLASLLRNVVLIPIKAAHSLLRVLKVTRRRISETRYLPVAGLDERQAQSILSTLRQSARSVKDLELSEQWLRALQLAQILSDRLYGSLRQIDSAARFWQARLQYGGHGLFLLMRQGPFHFVERLLSLLGVAPPKKLTATAEIEKKLVALTWMQSQLLELYARVHEAAGSLQLLSQLPMCANESILLSLTNHELFAYTKTAIIRTAMTVSQCVDRVHQLSTALEDGSYTELLGEARQRGLLEEPPRTPPRPSTSQGSGDDVRFHDTPQEQIPLGNTTLELERAQGWLLESRRTTAASDSYSYSALWDTAAQQSHRQILGSIRDGASASELLTRGQVVSSFLPPLLHLPPNVEAPSAYQQHWLQYLAGGCAVAWAVLFIYRHSWLSGSPDMDNWIRSAALACYAAYHDNVLQPLMALRGELFRTFRDRPSLVSREDLRADQDSLLRMLQRFAEDASKKGKIVLPDPSSIPPDQVDVEAVLPGMKFVMQRYEEELKNPIRNLIGGDLARALLIQVQKLKVDSETAMLELDQILRANELSISLVAAIPALLITSAAVTGLYRVAKPSPPNPRREALPARMAAIQVERCLGSLVEHNTPENTGRMLYCVARVYLECWALFLRHDRTEWHSLREDILSLAEPTPPAHKMAVAQRMIRAYTIFQQF